MENIIKVTLDDIKKILNDLIEERLTREEASSMAFQLRTAEDNNQLKYEPLEIESRAWRAILFIESYDLKDSPTTYLYNKEDIKRIFTELC